MTAPTRFSIEGKTLKLNTAADVATYVAEIERIENLEEIKLSGNTLGVEASKALAAALAKKTTLKVADLSDMFTGRLKEEIPLALEAFVDALVDKVHLRVLDLSDNAFGPAGAEPLRRLLIENRHIETLRLNNNGLGIGGGKFISTALLESAAKSKEHNAPTALKTIVMGRNRLESQGAEYLSKAFAEFPSLKELMMPQNSIRPEGVQVLLGALKSCKELEVLDLQDNTFTKKGSMALVDALPHWSKLRVLNVGDCMLGKVGSKAFMKALTESPSENLQTLVFTYNEMDESGAKLVPGLLRAKKTLSSLALNGNWFEAEADVVEEIRDTLRANGHVDGLDELEDMEEEDSEAEEEEEEEEEAEKSEKEEEEDVDELTKAMKKL
ncbi:hypothetical protein HDV05_002235 [Chytridiales sp. JEL 0842]|nr:hypothetical protein HDV05_002235 [Chytridiales sp. JEL 0842]